MLSPEVVREDIRITREVILPMLARRNPKARVRTGGKMTVGEAMRRYIESVRKAEEWLREHRAETRG